VNEAKKSTKYFSERENEGAKQSGAIVLIPSTILILKLLRKFFCYDNGMSDTIFDKIIRNEIPNYKVWEDDEFLAFLTPFPNTPGTTVVIPKYNPGDYIFSIDSSLYSRFLDAVKKVANLLEKSLEVNRVALVFEGTGVAYVHAKLYPLYGELASETDVWAGEKEFVEEYRGWITTLEGPEMDMSRLVKIQEKIRSIQV